MHNTRTFNHLTCCFCGAQKTFAGLCARGLHHGDEAGRKIQEFSSVVRYGERFVRAYNGGLVAEPPAGSRDRAPGQGGKAPWSWDIQFFDAL